MPILVLFACSGSSLHAGVSPQDQAASRAALLSGVNAIKTVGAPGSIAVFDPEDAPAGRGAFAVSRDAQFRVMIGAALWGNGRVVAYPHPGYVSFSDHADSNDTGQLYHNSILWVTQTTGLDAVILTSDSKAYNWLVSQGYTNATLRPDWENVLTGADLVIINMHNLSGFQSEALAAFIQSGGGLITGQAGWIDQNYPDPARANGNVFLHDAGLGWSTSLGTVNPVMPATTEYGNATAALILAEEEWEGSVTATPDELKESTSAFNSLIGVVPATNPFMTRLSEALLTRALTLNPTPATPVTGGFNMAALNWEAETLLNTPVAEITAHPTAAALYGAIPPGADRSAQTVTVDTGRNRWLSTGLYAFPGEPVTLVFPPELVGQGFSVRLNGHVDRLPTSSSAWKRVPYGISRSFPITTNTVTVAGAFGGAIYLDLGKGLPLDLGTFDVEITGAIRAPYFVLGKTTDASWTAGIRDYPAPYAEMECEGVIMSVPSSWIRKLDNPTDLMNFWNEVVARQDWVAAHETLRTSPERINFDVQISVGYLHSGYPQQGPSDYEILYIQGVGQSRVVNLKELKKEGSWGWFHELGHQMQLRPDESVRSYSSAYTFAGDIEVTCNIFANAALEHVVPSPPLSGWGWSAHPDEVMRRAITTVSDESAATFDEKDPYPFYFQLADGFGWETYRSVMAVYFENFAQDTAANLTNQQKKDLWLQRWSEVSGYNMVPYMVDQWKLEVSQEAIDTVNAMTDGNGEPLPHWMALGTTLPEIEVVLTEPTVVDLGAAGMALGGEATMTGFTPPQSGTLQNNGDGTFTYVASNGFEGSDTFTATYQSSLGNSQTFTTTVRVSDGATPLGSTLPGATARSGDPKRLDILGAAVSPDGGATVSSVSTPQHGTLTDNGDGTYTYLANPGFTGYDLITSTYRSSTGKLESFDTEILVKQGTVYHWKMDEGVGNQVGDSGPERATGRAVGTPEWVAGIRGSALHFDGSDDQVDFPGASPTLSGYTDFTISAWIKTTAGGEIIKQGGGVLGVHLIVLPTGGIQFFVHQGIRQQFSCYTNQGLVNDGQWHHIVAQRDGYTGRVWIDGRLESTSVAASTSKVNYAIDPAWISTIGNGNFRFTGVIDELRVHDYVIDVVPVTDINDSDSDGISDEMELAGRNAIGATTFFGQTDPFDPDSDNDGFNDEIESRLGTDPNDKSKNPDTARASIPDITIGPSPVEQSGEDLYTDTGAGQEYNATAKAGRSLRVYLGVGVDGDYRMPVGLKGSKGNRFFAIRYISMSGSGNVTGTVNRAGFFARYPGDSSGFVKVLVKPTKLGKKQGKGGSFTFDAIGNRHRDRAKLKVTVLER